MGGSIALTKPVDDTTFEIILPNLQNEAIEQKVFAVVISSNILPVYNNCGSELSQA